MVWSVFQRINWTLLLLRHCQWLDLLANLKVMFLCSMISLRRKMRFTSKTRGFTSYSCQYEKFSWFDQRWIGLKGSATEFLLQSSNLTPLDLYLWEALKNMVYATKPQTLEELRNKIEHTISDTPLAIIQIVCCSVRHCCWECTVAEG